MKWLILASLAGAAWCITVLALSLAFGGPLPVTALAMLASAAPAAVIVGVGWLITRDDGGYRTLHRFSPAAKRLALLFVALAVLGLGTVVPTFDIGTPEQVGGEYVLAFKEGVRKVVSKSDYLAAVAAIDRTGAGLALTGYAVSGLLLLVRMHYRAPVRRDVQRP